MTSAAFRNSLEEIFGSPRGSLKDSDTRDTVEGWTSLADVQVLSVISSELGIEPDADILEAESTGDLIRVLQDKGAFR